MYTYIGNDNGEIKCNNCSKLLGTWHWKPTMRQSLNNLVPSPVIRIHKHVVHESGMLFDSTPTITPRNATTSVTPRGISSTGGLGDGVGIVGLATTTSNNNNTNEYDVMHI